MRLEVKWCVLRSQSPFIVKKKQCSRKHLKLESHSNKRIADRLDSYASNLQQSKKSHMAMWPAEQEEL